MSAGVNVCCDPPGAVPCAALRTTIGIAGVAARCVGRGIGNGTAPVFFAEVTVMA